MFHPLFHFPGSLVGEGQGEYAESVYALGHEVGDPGGQHLGFPASGACDYHERAFSVEYGFPLLIVQSLQVILHGCKVQFQLRMAGWSG
jgi:hypothetical protein